MAKQLSKTTAIEPIKAIKFVENGIIELFRVDSLKYLQLQHLRNLQISSVFERFVNDSQELSYSGIFS